MGTSVSKWAFYIKYIIISEISILKSKYYKTYKIVKKIIKNNFLQILVYIYN